MLIIAYIHEKKKKLLVATCQEESISILCVSQLSSISLGWSEDHSMWNALKYQRKEGLEGTVVQKPCLKWWCEPDHVGSFRTNEGF